MYACSSVLPYLALPTQVKVRICHACSIAWVHAAPLVGHSTSDIQVGFKASYAAFTSVLHILVITMSFLSCCAIQIQLVWVIARWE